MPLGKHKKTETGRLRKERGDSLAKNLSKDYPAFKSVSGNTRLDTLEKKFGTSGVAKTNQALKKANGSSKS